MRSTSSGFTLLEVLASMALLALLMVGVYSGIRTATSMVRAGSVMIERNDQVATAQQFLRRELTQSLAQTIGLDASGASIVFAGTAHEIRYLAPLPGYLGKLGPQLQRLQLVEDGTGGLRLELSLALLPPDGQRPLPLGTPQVLVDHVASGAFSYSGIDASGRPVAWTQTWPDRQQLPRLVRVTLRLRGNAAWPELLVPLRVTSTTPFGLPAGAAALDTAGMP